MLFLCCAATAQTSPDLREILTRLDRLEKDNRALTEEVRALRKELADLHSPPTGATASDGAAAEDRAAEDRAAVEQSRVEELAQTKLESSQKFPIRFTGMALFNAYVNGRHNNQSVNPTIASFSHGDATGGATLRQSTIGLLFNGPLTVGGAKVSGSLYMDFFGGSAASLNHVVRLRTAEIDLDWTNTSIMFGQAKPIISPRDPDSLAQVGVSPLTGAGNLWLWQPQVRVEQRVKFGNSADDKTISSRMVGVPANTNTRRIAVTAAEGFRSSASATSALALPRFTSMKLVVGCTLPPLSGMMRKKRY